MLSYMPKLHLTLVTSTTSFYLNRHHIFRIRRYRPCNPTARLPQDHIALSPIGLSRIVPGRPSNRCPRNQRHRLDEPVDTATIASIRRSWKTSDMSSAG